MLIRGRYLKLFVFFYMWTLAFVSLCIKFLMICKLLFDIVKTHYENVEYRVRMNENISL